MRRISINGNCWPPNQNYVPNVDGSGIYRLVYRYVLNFFFCIRHVSDNLQSCTGLIFRAVQYSRRICKLFFTFFKFFFKNTLIFSTLNCFPILNNCFENLWTSWRQRPDISNYSIFIIMTKKDHPDIICLVVASKNKPDISIIIFLCP